jgi:hypothetical protein
MPFLPFLAIFGMIGQCYPNLAIDGYPHDAFGQFPARTARDSYIAELTRMVEPRDSSI